MKELQEVFNLEEDLFRPTEERNIPFKLKINKIIYLNKEQYHFMMEEYHKERKERYMNSRCLILIVSHNINDAYKYADRIIELSKGRIIKDESKNPMYMDNVVCHNNNIYYPKDKILNDNDINLINSNMNINTKIIKMDNKYISTFNQVITSEKVDIEKKKLSIFKELSLSFKFLKNKLFSIFLSSFMVSAIMVILALSQTIITFDAGEIISKEMNKMNQTSLFMEKTLSDEQRKLDLPFGDCVVEVEDEDYEKFKNCGYDGEIYEVMSISTPISFNSNYSGNKTSVFTHGIYINETLGTMIVDEDFFINKLGNIEFICESEDIRLGGLYITDYVADSILLNNTAYKEKTYYDNVVNINVVLIILLSIISLFIPMIKIKNIKPVKIIKTKD